MNTGKNALRNDQKNCHHIITEYLATLENLKVMIRMDERNLGFLNPFLLLHPRVVDCLKSKDKKVLGRLERATNLG